MFEHFKCLNLKVSIRCYCRVQRIFALKRFCIFWCFFFVFFTVSIEYQYTQSVKIIITPYWKTAENWERKKNKTEAVRTVIHLNALYIQRWAQQVSQQQQHYHQKQPEQQKNYRVCDSMNHCAAQQNRTDSWNKKQWTKRFNKCALWLTLYSFYFRKISATLRLLLVLTSFFFFFIFSITLHRFMRFLWIHFKD